MPAIPNNRPFGYFVTPTRIESRCSLALEFFQCLPAAGFRILAAVKVVSLRDLHHAHTLRVPLVAAKPAASVLRQRFDFRR